LLFIPGIRVTGLDHDHDIISKLAITQSTPPR
jgi:hypothetical protein